MRLLLSIFFIAFCHTCFAKKSIHLRFENYYKGGQLILDSVYRSSGDSIIFETLRYYISSVSFYNKGNLVFAEPNSYHLIDIEDATSSKITLELPDANFDHLQFNLGVDSLTNVSGAQDGDLDPAKGMYWAWQTGYINFKLEGYSSHCNTSKHAFQFHLGGYRFPITQKISLPANNREDITAILSIDNILKQTDLSTQNIIMIPCQAAVDVSKIIAGSFQIVQ